MATFVLVHGGWSGAHGFRAVRRLLQAEGHEVFTPSLTGIGERVHLVSPQVDLTTHVQDVVNTVLYEDLRDVILLGYSYGGAVVTGSVAHIGSRIRELVYLDAFVPSDGDTVSGLSGGDTAPTTVLGEHWLLPPPFRDYDDPDEAAWQNARRVPPAPVLHRTSTRSDPGRRALIRTHLHQGDRRLAGRSRRQRVLAGSQPSPSVEPLALPRDRDEPHGRQQPAAAARRDPPGTRMTRGRAFPAASNSERTCASCPGSACWPRDL